MVLEYYKMQTDRICNLSRPIFFFVFFLGDPLLPFTYNYVHARARARRSKYYHRRRPSCKLASCADLQLGQTQSVKIVKNAELVMKTAGKRYDRVRLEVRGGL